MYILYTYIILTVRSRKVDILLVSGIETLLQTIIRSYTQKVESDKKRAYFLISIG
jgi:hypothetical protein